MEITREIKSNQRNFSTEMTMRPEPFTGIVGTMTSFLFVTSQWEEYIHGWQLLLESGDLLFWTVLVLVAWVVRAISLTVLILQLGDKLLRHKKNFEYNLIVTGIIFLVVTVPFVLADLPLIYPFVPR